MESLQIEATARLQAARDEVAIARRELLTVKLDAMTKAKKLADVTRPITLAVHTATDAAGKKLYSNDAMRDAEIESRLSVTPQYEDDFNARQAVMIKEVDLKIALDYLEEVQLIYRAGVEV